jgi:hypothetical protein
VTFFFDRTAWPAQEARPVVMEVKEVPRWEPAAKGERVKTQKLVYEKQQRLWDDTPLDRPLALPLELGRQVAGSLGRPSSRTHGART